MYSRSIAAPLVGPRPWQKYIVCFCRGDSYVASIFTIEYSPHILFSFLAVHITIGTQTASIALVCYYPAVLCYFS